MAVSVLPQVKNIKEKREREGKLMLYKHTMVWQHNITSKCLFSLFSSSIQKIV